MACWLRRCHECNFPLGSKELFCPRCGAKQRREKLCALPDDNTLRTSATSLLAVIPAQAGIQ